MYCKMKIAFRILIVVETITLVVPLLWPWAVGIFISTFRGFFPYLILLLPMGFGLFSALTLALHYEKYAHDRIPRWVWIGLIVGVSASIWLTDFAGLPINWRYGGFYHVVGSLIGSGIGAMISVVTCLFAVFWLRRNIDEELNLQFDADPTGRST